MFCSRVVSSCGKTAEWPFGSSFGNSRQVPLGLACDRHTLASLFVIAKGFVVPRRFEGRRCSVGRRGVLGPVPQTTVLQPFSNLPKPDLLQLSLPQPGHQHLLHCALRLGSFGTSWITCTSLIPWATSCSPKTAGYQPYQLEAGAGDPVAGRDPLPAPIAYLYEQWRPLELHIVGLASWMTRPTPFAAMPRLLPPA